MARQNTEAPKDAVKQPPAEIAPTPAAEEAPTVRPCVLDEAPVGSKILAVTPPATGKGRIPVLMTPLGEQSIPENDVSRELPLGARVVKRAADVFYGEQLDAQDVRPALVRSTARAVIAAFNAHFHDVQPVA